MRSRAGGVSSSSPASRGSARASSRIGWASKRRPEGRRFSGAARGRARGRPPTGPWAQIIRAHIGEREGAALEALFGAATPYLAQLVPELRDQRPDLAAPPPLDAEQARFRLFDTITTLLKRAAETRPLLLILDDLQ
jgi:hypothetical protein